MHVIIARITTWAGHEFNGRVTLNEHMFETLGIVQLAFSLPPSCFATPNRLIGWAFYAMVYGTIIFAHCKTETKLLQSGTVAAGYTTHPNPYQV